MAGPSSPETSIDAGQLAVALRSGVHRVMLEQEILNRINVFPVADGDTGTNLSMSLGAAIGVLEEPGDQLLGPFLARLSDVLIDGARGNSGAILAQFFQGMSDAAEDLERFTLATLADSVTRGSEYAHDALSNPREGTILSVIAAFAARLKDHTGGELSVADALSSATEAARLALIKTEEQLDVLRKAGVVDAGAQGFVTLVDGVRDFVVDGRFTDKPDFADAIAITEPIETAGEEQSLTYRYCTECLINGEDIDRRKLRERLSALGDSLVLAGTKRKAKVHVHVNEPEAVFEIAGDYGEVSGMKADDMYRQQHSTHHVQARFAVITDSAADIPDDDMDRLDIHMVPCRVQFGERGYLDKVGITSEEFFAELEQATVMPTTSQPSPGDFRRQYQYLASHFPDVLSISLTPKVSGTYQAALSAAERTRASGRVHVVDSRNASLGQGQIAMFAAECAKAGLDIDSTMAAVMEIIPRTTSYCLIRDLSYAVRGGRIAASKKRIADWLKLTPVVRTRPDGRISAQGILPGRRNLLPKFARYIARDCSRDADLHLAIGHAVCLEDAERLQSMLLERLPNIRRSSMTELGSALGAHGGPGAIVAAVQEYTDPSTLVNPKR